MKLSCVILAKDADHCIQNAVDSVVGHVDKVFIYIDSRSAPMRMTLTFDTRGRALDQADLRAVGWVGEPTVFTSAINHFDDATGYSGAYNRARDLAGGDWHFLLDADETLDPHHAAVLRKLCHQGDRDRIDAWGFSRYNWHDLARTSYSEAAFPDVQWRLLKAHVRFKWRVHSALVGAANAQEVNKGECAINHFNLAYRTQADWDAVNEVYDRLMALDLAEGRIP